jgi:PAS domain S-box-containing protein
VTYRVLLVDDVVEIRLILALMLEQSGFFEVVGEAGTGPEGLKMAGELQPDVLVLDVEMPGPSGWDVLPAMREALPDAKIVVLSGTASENARVEPAVRALASAVLEKGMPAGDLVSELLSILGPSELAITSAQVTGPARGPVDDADAAPRLVALVESSEDAIVGNDLDGIVLSWNPAAERIFGYTADEMVGRSGAALWPPERVSEVAHIFERVGRGERVVHHETVRVRKDGRRIDVSLTVSPVIAVDGRIVGASSIARDITARRQADIALAGAVAQLENQNRRLRRSNEELDSFAFVASHDLAQPLQVAYGYLEMLKSEFGATLDPTANEWLEAASGSLERMRRLVQDILAYSRTGSRDAPRAPNELREVVDDALIVIGALVQERDAEIVIDRLPVVHGNEGQLSQLFQNLIGNAIKFVPQDTRPRIRVTAEPDPDGWRLSIIDNGPGVPEDMREKVFDMFQRAKGNEASGTGVGLAIAKKLVEAHGGRIWVEAAPGGSGSAFRMVLPATTEAPSERGTE